MYFDIFKNELDNIDGLDNEEYLANILNRASVQFLRNFYLTGKEAPRINPQTYQTRLKLSKKPIVERLEHIYKNDLQELEESEKELLFMSTEYKNVFMEIGLKMGARLIIDLIRENKNAFKADI